MTENKQNKLGKYMAGKFMISVMRGNKTEKKNWKCWEGVKNLKRMTGMASLST